MIEHVQDDTGSTIAVRKRGSRLDRVNLDGRGGPDRCRLVGGCDLAVIDSVYAGRVSRSLVVEGFRMRH